MSDKQNLSDTPIKIKLVSCQTSDKRFEFDFDKDNVPIMYTPITPTLLSRNQKEEEEHPP